MSMEHRRHVPYVPSEPPIAREPIVPRSMMMVSVREPTLDELRRFYDRVFDEVVQYALRLTGGDPAAAEDLVQEAFVGLVRSWRDGRIDRLEIGWLITVVRQRFLDGVRRQTREERRLRLVSNTTATTAPAAEEHEIEPLLAMNWLGELPARARAALVFRYVDDLPVADVANELGVSTRAAESLLARSRRQLRKIVEEERRG
ncbi:MAG: RNA polymerase sigma factor [Ilumatobacteraceae bacterium]